MLTAVREKKAGFMVVEVQMNDWYERVREELLCDSNTDKGEPLTACVSS